MQKPNVLPPHHCLNEVLKLCLDNMNTEGYKKEQRERREGV